MKMKHIVVWIFLPSRVSRQYLASIGQMKDFTIDELSRLSLNAPTRPSTCVQ